MPGLELFGSRTCPFTSELREDLLWRRREFVEHDVEADPEALRRLLELTGGRAVVPVLAEDGKVTDIGRHGRTCFVAASQLIPGRLR